MSTAEAPRISRDDIETKLRQLKGDAEEVAGAQRQTGLIAAAIGGVVLLVVVYMLGRRKGRKRSAFVEIRRL